MICTTKSVLIPEYCRLLKQCVIKYKSLPFCLDSSNTFDVYILIHCRLLLAQSKYTLSALRANSKEGFFQNGV